MAQYDTTNQHAESHGSVKSYTIGFFSSLVLTFIPLAVVMNGWFEGKVSTIILMTAAVLQLAVQLIFFMHLREEKKPRYNLMSLIFGLVIMLLIVAGSMWIMLFNMVAT